MNLPSFEQFQSDMGSDYFKRLLEQNSDVVTGTFDFQSKKGIVESVDKLVSASYFLTLDMLADYHEWLARQLTD